MLRVQRLDRWGVRLDAGTVQEVEGIPGAVDVWGVATRVGVFEYDDPGSPSGIIREYRPPSEVLDPKSLETLVGVPFTLDHPADLVDASNFQDLTHGHVLEAKVEGDLVKVRIRIVTAEAQEVIRRGTVELSCGYTAILLESPGVTPTGEAFDAVQTEIVYNHLALVDLARAGHVARLHLDAKGARVQRRDQARRSLPTMKRKIKIDGKTYEIGEMLIASVSMKADEAAAKKRRGDTIETASVSLETPDGMVDLILPASAVDDMLALIAPSESAAAGGGKEPPPAPPAPGSDEMGGEMGGGAPGGEGPEELDDERKQFGDKALEDRIDSAVAKALAKRLPEAMQAREDRARDRSALERKCAPFLTAGYVFDSADDLDIMLDTIEAAAPERHTDAKDLVNRARKGDARAHGRLEAWLDDAVAEERDRQDSTGEQIEGVFEMRRNTADAADATPRKRSDSARDRRLARLRGETQDAAG